MAAALDVTRNMNKCMDFLFISTNLIYQQYGSNLPTHPGAAFWGQQIEVGMLRNNYEMSTDAINYD